MKNIARTICAAVLPALIMAGCGNEPADTPPAEETVPVTTTTINEYVLVRSWTADELLKSIYFCGEYHSFPIIPAENENFIFSDGYVIFPDGSQAYTASDGDGNITRIEFDRQTAPSDLSVLGIDLSSVPDDIPDKVGIADSIYGDKNETMTYSFFGGGITELTFVYTNKTLEKIYICA